ncbi:MAG: [protein-PII] uridylyltransferase [Deltaproteobacteria bacterium]|nr:[protein-PII] uridylyltransferase [Deltaproteobacteria bacterium]
MNKQESPVSVLREKKELLISRFLKGDEPCFLERHAEILDDYFRESFAESSVGPRMRMNKNPYAIIALGGYGRKEQCLHSDVDVLLLFKKKIPVEAKGVVKEIFYPLWDLGLDVGYATRTLKECSKLACHDFEVLTSLIDARFLCGISSLYSDLMEQLHGKVLHRYGRAYIEWLAERNQGRHARFGDSSYLLEPNLKEGLGGLRDYHSILWGARAKYDLKEPRDLEFFGHLSNDEFQGLCNALSFIWRVRSRLHYLSGRKCDQLYFEYQVKLARDLGFRQDNGQQAVEVFLGTLHGHMEFLKQQHLMFLNKVLSKKQRSGKGVRRAVSKGLEVVYDALNFESPETIPHNPKLLIKIFERSARLGIPLSIEAKRLVKEFLYLIDENFRSSRAVVQSFERILVAPPQIFNVLNEMLNTGIMVALIPELKGIINRIQYDEYHLYPVDKHTLRTVQTLKGFGDPGREGRDTLCRKLFSEIARPALLLWAALLHDVGKGGHSKDHARHGSGVVRSVFGRMGFAKQDIDTVSFLVREHLLLINTATRRDLNDEKTVVQCAGKIRDTESLKMLYLLTVADSRATGPKAWNDWTAVLLKELFFKVYHILKKGELATPAAVDILEKKRQEVLGRAVAKPGEVEALFNQMPPRYLLYTPSKDILRHIDIYQKLGHEPFVLDIQAIPGTNYRTATICARDFSGLFSKIAGVLTLNNIDILNAHIYTWRNHIALDIFKVKAPLDTLLEEEVWTRVKNDLQSALKEGPALGPALDQKLMAYQTLQKRIEKRPDKIVVDNRTSDFFTIVEVYTHNFPGLLYKITDTLFQCKLDIWVAKIATKVDQAVDVFYVRDFDGQKVDTPEQIGAIKEAIMKILTNGQAEIQQD